MDEFSLSFGTWFWLFVPMSLVVILSLISMLKERGNK
ncbi:hypothetical protein SAMN05216362_1417 [Piscibacillus halophilus]|uniref:Uncharacterized protein n=1 Tax=Piscibacillus halophilus TaxID=571933 RepID=A0A1H9KUK2_9BACI|nr:hypothetical protein SAMN05216362_1417 [Piscibacillus halophilus]